MAVGGIAADEAMEDPVINMFRTILKFVSCVQK